MTIADTGRDSPVDRRRLWVNLVPIWPGAGGLNLGDSPVVLGRHRWDCHTDLLHQLRLCGAQVQCYTSLERMDAEAHCLPRGLDPPLDLAGRQPEGAGNEAHVRLLRLDGQHGFDCTESHEENRSAHLQNRPTTTGQLAGSFRTCLVPPVGDLSNEGANVRKLAFHDAYLRSPRDSSSES